jgi:hypothetical protein
MMPKSLLPYAEILKIYEMSGYSPCRLTPSSLHCEAETFITISTKTFSTLTLCKLRSRSQLFTRQINRNHPENTQHTQPSQDRNTLCNANVDEQGPCIKYTSTSHRTPHKIIARKQTSCIFWVRERYVNKNTLQNQERPKHKDNNTNQRNNPMDTRARGPSEKKETDWYEEGSENCRNETMLLFSEAVGQVIWDHVPFKV